MPKKDKTRKRGSWSPLSSTQIAQVHRLIKRRRGSTHVSYREISNRTGVSLGAIHKIRTVDMSKRAREERRHKCAHNRLLSVQQEKLVVGWVLERTIQSKSSTTTDFRNFIAKQFQRTVSSSWITKFLHRNDLSLRTARPVKALFQNKKTFSNALHFLTDLHARHLQPNQIACLDKTGIYTDVKNIKQIGPRGR